jgi:hypothetical protein
MINLMKNTETEISIKCLRELLTPIVRFCIRHSVTTGDLLRQVKSLFVELGIEEIQSHGKNWNISRLSVLTGMRRQEVMKFKENPLLDSSRSGLIIRVVRSWNTDRKYLDADDQPRLLTANGPESEFHQLVMDISTDISPKSVLVELLRKQIVSQDAQGVRLNLKQQVAEHEALEKFKLLENDLDRSIRAAEQATFS